MIRNLCNRIPLTSNPQSQQKSPMTSTEILISTLESLPDSDSIRFRLGLSVRSLVLVNCLGGLLRNRVVRVTVRARNDLKCVEGP